MATDFSVLGLFKNSSLVFITKAQRAVKLYQRQLKEWLRSHTAIRNVDSTDRLWSAIKCPTQFWLKNYLKPNGLWIMSKSKLQQSAFNKPTLNRLTLNGSMDSLTRRQVLQKPIKWPFHWNGSLQMISKCFQLLCFRKSAVGRYKADAKLKGDHMPCSSDSEFQSDYQKRSSAVN